jgi:hypothetical protein
MGLGLLLLASTGSENDYFNLNPNITFLKKHSSIIHQYLMKSYLNILDLPLILVEDLALKLQRIQI